MDGGISEQRVYVFGQFRLDPISRALSEDGAPVPLAPRLLETLLYLVENHGRLVEREELVQAVWPGRIVEDGNLAKAISSLRTVLRRGGQTEHFIVTAPGRGYRFAVRVSSHSFPSGLAEIHAISAPGPMQATSGASSPRRRRTILALAGLASGIAVLCIIAGLPVARRDAPFAPPQHSVAVLPFSHANASDEQLSHGVSEELINALGRVGALRVAGRMSSFSFEGRQTSMGEIARLLNVATLLEGSVRRDGAHLRVTAQLIDARTGYQLWAQAYDLDQTGLLALERQIAEAVTASLKIVLEGRDAARLALGGTDNQAAFDAYLAGMASLARADEDTNAAAIADFSEAIARDPRYALAYAQRARALAYRAVTATLANTAAPGAVMEAARRDAETAVSIAPDLGAAHAALALVMKLSLAEFGQAQAELQQAMTLSPGDVVILMDYGFFELYLGHETVALAAAERAVALDPLTPRTYQMLAEILAFARRYDEAFVALRRAGTLGPAGQAPDRQFLGIVQQLRGDAPAALRSCAGARDYYDLACLAWAYNKAGRQGEAQSALDRLHALLGDNGTYIYARIAAQWGRREEAFGWLRKAYAMRDAGLLAIRIDPFMDALRSAPEYREIEQDLALPP